MDEILSQAETRAILDAVAGLRGKLRIPVVIVDRTGEKPRAEAYDRDALIRATDDGSPQAEGLRKLLKPTEYPFLRVVVFGADRSAHSFRIARAEAFSKGVA